MADDAGRGWDAMLLDPKCTSKLPANLLRTLNPYDEPEVTASWVTE